ncbi:MAG: hypothetical protein AAF449_24155 [Myxococcota bacterium]
MVHLGRLLQRLPALMNILIVDAPNTRSYDSSLVAQGFESDRFDPCTILFNTSSRII